MNRQLHYLCAAFLGAGMLHITPPLCAQTEVNQGVDVTEQYLKNAGFETNPTGVTTENYVYDVPDWEENPAAGSHEFYKLGTLSYGENNAILGQVPTNGSSVQDENNKSLLGVKLHWCEGVTIGISQTATLPAGTYELTYDTYVTQTVENGTSWCGYSINGNTPSYKALPSEINTWENNSQRFSVTEENTQVTFTFGYTKTANAGGGNSPILFIDNIKLIYHGIDKSTLNSLIQEANTLYQEGTAGAPALKSAIEAAEEIANKADASQGEVSSAEEALAAAIKQYPFDNATPENPLDLTSYIKNPGFEGNCSSNDKTINVPEGWSMANTVSGWLDGKKTNSKPTPVEGASQYNLWAGSITKTDLYQEISSLPEGEYSLSASVYSGVNEATDQHLYATIGEATSVSPNYSTDGSYQELTVTFTVTTSNTPIRIGITSTGNGSTSAGWFCVDNFKLNYLGYDIAAAIQTLATQAEAAKAISQEAMSSEAKEDLQDAISAAQTIINNQTGSRDEINAASQTLSAATEQANVSITLYSEISATLEKATAYTDAIIVTGDAKSQYENAISSAKSAYDEGTATEQTITEVETAMLTYMKAQTATPENPADYTLLITNPDFSTGDVTGWDRTHNCTDNNIYSDGVSSDETFENSYFFTKDDGYLRHATIYQTLSAELEPGVYGLAADLYGRPKSTNEFDGTFIYITTGNVDHWANPTFSGNVATSNLPTKEMWENVEAILTLPEASSNVRIGALSWGVNKVDENLYGNFRVDNFKLYYYGKSLVKGESDLTVNGIMTANELNEYLTSEVTSVDIRDAVITEGTLSPKNPNTVIYGLEGEEKVLELQEGYKFNAPEAIAANVTYTRLAFATDEGTKVNHEALRGWQTICLPFDVTEITAEKDQFAVPLKPIMNADFDNGVDDSNDNYAHPFWLYAIIDGELAPATEIKANVPYLMLVPNDPDFYAPFYNIPGDITFKGNAIAATDLQVQDGSDYDLLGYFGGTAENLPVQEGTTYYGLNAEGSAFVQTGFAPIASFQAFATLPTTPQAAPQTLSIFDDGDGQLTALPNIREALGDRASGIQVYTADGGIRIESAKAGSVTVYTVDGQALQTVALTAGGSEFVALPAGKYIVNGTVVIAQ